MRFPAAEGWLFSVVRADFMLQNYHPADIQGLAFNFISCRQRKILDPNPARRMCPGQFFAFRCLQSLRLSGCLHNVALQISAVRVCVQFICATRFCFRRDGSPFQPHLSGNLFHNSR